MIEDALRGHGTRARAVHEKAYLKSDLEHLGTTVPQTRRAVTTAVRGRTLTHADVLATVDELWSTGVFELRFAAVELLVVAAKRDLLVARDLALVETLVRASRTWALVDPLAIYVTGALAGGAGRVLDRWARDDDFWIRRAAMLALLVPLRAGGGDFDRFARYADAMLDDTEFFIRKAIGWVLRETSKRRPDLVAAWLMPRAARAAGLVVREASKHLPASQRAALLAAHR